MSKFLIICCDDGRYVEAITAILRAELCKADYYFRVADGSDRYYAIEELASDTTQCSVIDVRTPEPEEGE